MNSSVIGSFDNLENLVQNVVIKQHNTQEQDLSCPLLGFNIAILAKNYRFE